MRHGQSFTNAKLTGVTHETHNYLTMDGIQMAIGAADTLMEQKIQPTHLMCSTIPRAYQTMMTVTSRMALPLNILQTSTLNEMRMFPDDAFLGEAEWTKLYTKEHMKRYFHEHDFRAFPSAETQQDVYNRSRIFLENVVSPLVRDGHVILVITHFFVMRAVISYFHGHDSEKMHLYSPENCEIYRCDAESFFSRLL
jgi:broad specificity phosphatase PhoE